MRTMRTLLALLLLAAPVAGQQLDVVVSGGVSYRVATADSDSTISTHATYHVALESAANFALRTGRMALVLHTSETRVRAFGMPPVVEPGPDPDPAPGDPPTNLPVVFSADFEQAADLGAFFELDGFQRVGGELVATIPTGTEFGGSAKLGLGAVPDTYFDPVGDPETAYTDLRWCADLRITGAAGVPYKVARVAAFAGADWSEASVAHVWGSPTAPVLTTDPVTSVVGSTVTATAYNDFDAFRWLGQGGTSTSVVDGATHRVCARQRYNTPGQADGLMEVWVDGRSESRVANLDWRGSYQGFGWNALFLEAFYNGGAPSAITMAWDNLEVRAAGVAFEEPGTDPDPEPDPDPDPEPTPGDAWYVQDWSYNSTAQLLAGVQEVRQKGGGVELLTGLTGTPGGFRNAARMRFDGGAGVEPEVGVDLVFPRATTDRPTEVWVEYYARWSDNWHVNGNPYPSIGHKHFFLFDQEETGPGRWEHINGLGGGVISMQVGGNLGPGENRREFAPSIEALWDGGWHLVRYHARMDDRTGTWEVWIDGQHFTWGVGDTSRKPGLHFWKAALSRNSNAGFRVTATLDFGPVRVYIADPGWR